MFLMLVELLSYKKEKENTPDSNCACVCIRTITTTTKSEKGNCKWKQSWQTD